MIVYCPACDGYAAVSFDPRYLVCGHVSPAEAHARWKDPDTSHKAARSVDANRLEKIVVDALRTNGPMTTKEIAGITGIHEWSISPRMAPLERKGLVCRTEERRDRQIVWEAVAQ